MPTPSEKHPSAGPYLLRQSTALNSAMPYEPMGAIFIWAAVVLFQKGVMLLLYLLLLHCYSHLSLSSSSSTLPPLPSIFPVPAKDDECISAFLYTLGLLTHYLERLCILPIHGCLVTSFAAGLAFFCLLSFTLVCSSWCFQLACFVSLTTLE